MKLVTFKHANKASFGALENGQIMFLDGLAPDLASLLCTGIPDALPIAADRIPLSEVTLLPPIPKPGKIVCVGLNYRSHLALLDDPTPEVPILFTKPNTSLIGSGEAIVLPPVTKQVDFEGELAVVIGKKAKYVSEKDALQYVGGYTCANDISAHDIEFRTSQWTSGKMLDTFCPLGPVLVTADEIANPNALRLRTVLNGQMMQNESTSDMLFSVPKLIEYISSLATLEPGDIILTGTPAGLGCMRHPPLFLKDGDEISVEIEGIGSLKNSVRAEVLCAA